MIKHLTYAWGVCMLSILLCPHPAPASDSTRWTRVDDGVYINEQTLLHKSGSVHSFWVRVVPHRDSSLWRSSRNLLRDLGKDHASLSYMAYLAEIDCMNARHRQMAATYFKEDDNIITSLSRDSSNWLAIGNEKTMGNVYRTVCADFFPADLYTGSC